MFLGGLIRAKNFLYEKLKPPRVITPDSGIIKINKKRTANSCD